jgi:hypothetical protein
MLLRTAQTLYSSLTDSAGYFLPVKRINYKSLTKSIAMKNVFIVLLIAAIGAGVYYYFNQKQKGSLSTPKALILGKWKLDSMADKHIDTTRRWDALFISLDSAFRNYEVEVKKDIFISKSPNEEMKDTGYYQFADHVNVLTWSNRDTTRAKWSIERLDSAILILMDKDSTFFYFQRMK